MQYAMKQPWWLTMTEAGDRETPRGKGGHGGRRGGPRQHDEQAGEGRGPRGGRGPGGFGSGGFGPGGPGGFGPGGPGGFGPGGPGGFGPGMPGMGKPFPGGPRGRHRRGGRARRGDVRSAILALLLGAPLNGYQVIRELDERTNGAWKPSPGAVYPALSQLEDEGLIEAFDHDGQRAFRLTDTGRTAAEAIDPTPWDVVNAEAGTGTDGAEALMRELASLSMAAKAVMAAGSAEQVQAATAAVAETRKKLFGLLAGDDEG